MNSASFSNPSVKTTPNHVSQKSLGKGSAVDTSKSLLSGFKSSVTSFVSTASTMIGNASKKGLAALQHSSRPESITPTRLSPSIANMKASAMSFCTNVGSLIGIGLASAKESIGSGRATYLTEAVTHAAESAGEGLKGLGEIAEKSMPALEILGGALGIGHALSEFKEGFESLNKAKESKTMGGKIWNGSMGIAKIATGVLYGAAGAAVLAGASLIAAPILGTVTGGVAIIDSMKNMGEAKQLSNLPAQMDKLFPSTDKEGVAIPKKVNDALRNFASGGVEKRLPVAEQKKFIESLAKSLQALDPGNKAFSTENITREYSKNVKEYAGLKKDVCVNKAKASAVKAGTALTLGWGMVGLAATGVGAAVAIPMALGVGVAGYTQWSKFDKAADKSQEKMDVKFPPAPSTEAKNNIKH